MTVETIQAGGDRNLALTRPGAREGDPPERVTLHLPIAAERLAWLLWALGQEGFQLAEEEA